MPGLMDLFGEIRSLNVGQLKAMSDSDYDLYRKLLFAQPDKHYGICTPKNEWNPVTTHPTT